MVFTARFPGLPPSAESHYTISAPYGLLTRYFNCRRIPSFVVSSPHRVWLAGGQDTICHQRRGYLVYRPSLFRSFHTDVITRCSGPPGVNLGYFQRTIVRYTEVFMMDRGLYPVLRTRPEFPRLICLPSTFRYGAYLFVDPRFCLQPPSEIASRQSPCHWLPFASIRLGLDFT